ncbi:antitoxin Xre-like helix-turn-helix domain-containing protein [Hansschlegelia sp.]|uniref:antitoxin Xre-like helix-turn-helix domain-containing protein n=1 Tax=Hansschlegelia sp. TaxID=2041892 RepID=UPI002CAE7C1F|nr:antitoxin Xre-like helix-turn-helix domain-containing protein [Hansschlegelia sp.]HVI30432.1 antitoxin Xre-like helix-turn-helix domain-containing protein [Hansschlegelia sp.]
MSFPETAPLQAQADAKDRTATIVKAVVRACEFWGLTNREAADLFDVPIATWNRMKAGTFSGRLDQDKLTRASLIVGIFKALRILFNQEMVTGWPKAANTGPLFQGRSPVAWMIEGGIPAMLRTRRYLDGLRGGL